ncbi:hypothetical protein BC941DRAFT_457756 [Chlamydoabsidia padenii]|nr:hypothetical protein BC941DRAFT_457756 [Chlamydoabsidia padenii]
MPNSTCCCCIPIRAGVLIIAALSAAYYIGSIVTLAIHKQQFNAPEYGSQAGICYWVLMGICILYSLSSLFGIVGAAAKHRGMVNVFKGLYWFMSVLSLIASLGLWILMMVNRDQSVSICSEFLQHPGTYGQEFEPITKSEADDYCSSSMRTILIVSGVFVFVGNFIQIYFACAISAYASRLKRTNQHQKLRNLEDFPVEPLGKAHY